jgi:hypothetical protein
VFIWHLNHFQVLFSQQNGSAVSQDDINGYTVAYDQDELQFPVYVVVVMGVALCVAAMIHANVILLVLGFAALCYGYYNVPLLETGRPRIGAGQYGIFVEGLGIISWRATKDIDLVAVEMRGIPQNELQITLAQPLERALIADWRQRPMHRLLMRLPWSITGKGVIRIPLDVFDHDAGDIHKTFVRMLRFYRS